MPEAADRQHGADQRYRRDHRVNARAIRKPTVYERTGEIDSSAEGRYEAFDENEDLVRVGKMNCRLLEPPVTLDPHSAGAIDHDLRDAVIAQQRRKLAETEQTVFEPALEQPQLARGDDQPLVDERLA